MHQRDLQARATTEALPPYLLDWWNEFLDDLDDVVANCTFVEGIVQWFHSKGCAMSGLKPCYENIIIAPPPK